MAGFEGRYRWEDGGLEPVQIDGGLHEWLCVNVDGHEVWVEGAAEVPEEELVQAVRDQIIRRVEETTAPTQIREDEETTKPVSAADALEDEMTVLEGPTNLEALWQVAAGEKAPIQAVLEAVESLLNMLILRMKTVNPDTDSRTITEWHKKKAHEFRQQAAALPSVLSTLINLDSNGASDEILDLEEGEKFVDDLAFLSLGLGLMDGDTDLLNIKRGIRKLRDHAIGLRSKAVGRISLEQNVLFNLADMYESQTDYLEAYLFAISQYRENQRDDMITEGRKRAEKLGLWEQLLKFDSLVADLKIAGAMRALSIQRQKVPLLSRWRKSRKNVVSEANERHRKCLFEAIKVLNKNYHGKEERVKNPQLQLRLRIQRITAVAHYLNGSKYSDLHHTMKTWIAIAFDDFEWISRAVSDAQFKRSGALSYSIMPELEMLIEVCEKGGRADLCERCKKQSLMDLDFILEGRRTTHYMTDLGLGVLPEKYEKFNGLLRRL